MINESAFRCIISHQMIIVQKHSFLIVSETYFWGILFHTVAFVVDMSELLLQVQLNPVVETNNSMSTSSFTYEDMLEPWRVWSEREFLDLITGFLKLQFHRITVDVSLFLSTCWILPWHKAWTRCGAAAP